MMKTNHLKLGILLTVLLGSQLAFAAKPVSIKYNLKAKDAEGNTYLVYQVKCSNGAKKSITAWDNKKLWCEGKGKKDICNKKQIKTAKAVCKK